jgi:hypothetical protein
MSFRVKGEDVLSGTMNKIYEELSQEIGINKYLEFYFFDIKKECKNNNY